MAHMPSFRTSCPVHFEVPRPFSLYFQKHFFHIWYVHALIRSHTNFFTKLLYLYIAYCSWDFVGCALLAWVPWEPGVSRVTSSKVQSPTSSKLKNQNFQELSFFEITPSRELFFSPTIIYR